MAIFVDAQVILVDQARAHLGASSWSYGGRLWLLREGDMYWDFHLVASIRPGLDLRTIEGAEPSPAFTRNLANGDIIRTAEAGPYSGGTWVIGEGQYLDPLTLEPITKRQP